MDLRHGHRYYSLLQTLPGSGMAKMLSGVNCQDCVKYEEFWLILDGAGWDGVSMYKMERGVLLIPLRFVICSCTAICFI